MYQLDSDNLKVQWPSIKGVLKFILGCPSSCKCDEFGEGEDKRILVTGEDLLNVPSNLPSNTGAVYVHCNRSFLKSCFIQ